MLAKPVKVSLIVKDTHPWIDFVHAANRLDHAPKKLKESQILLVHKQKYSKLIKINK